MEPVGVFFLTLFSISLISGIMWAITKFYAKIGLYLIPILMAAIASYVAGRTEFDAIIIAICSAIGIFGLLLNYIFVDLYNLNRRIKKIEKVDNIEDKVD